MMQTELTVQVVLVVCVRLFERQLPSVLWQNPRLTAESMVRAERGVHPMVGSHVRFNRSNMANHTEGECSTVNPTEGECGRNHVQSRVPWPVHAGFGAGWLVARVGWLLEREEHRTPTDAGFGVWCVFMPYFK
jgi:hypothetical protein